MYRDNYSINRELIIKCKKNDKNAFMELYKHYEKYLYKLCFSYVQNEQDALDISQEVYIKVFSNIKRFDEKYPFHPWFRRIAVNTCINFKRAEKNNTISLQTRIDEEDRTLEDVIAAEEDIESNIEKLEMSRLIKRNLGILSPKQRMVVILRYFEDLSYDEIAEMLKIPLGTVKTDLFRARNILKNKLSCLHWLTAI